MIFPFPLGVENPNYKANEYNLHTMLIALERLGNPHLRMKNVIHIAGTNGKGSTTTMIWEILRKSGYKAHKFISPHLVKCNERITIYNNEITDVQFMKYSQYCADKLEDLGLSYFEGMTIIAILAFLENPADFCVFEVGLGGRLDATNIFPEKLISVITSISFDHTKILGNIIEEIAKEKAMIIAESKFAVTTSQNKYPNALKEIKSIAEQYSISLFVQNKDFSCEGESEKNFSYKSERLNVKISDISCKMNGIHQIENASLAITAGLILRERFGCNLITENSIKSAIKSAFIHGRIEEIDQEIVQKIFNSKESENKIFIDGSHNEDSIEKLKDFVLNIKSKRKRIGVFSCLKDKDIKAISKSIKEINFDKIFITEIKSNERRAMKIDDIYNSFVSLSFGDLIEKMENFRDIFEEIKAEKNLDIFIFGSLYFAGDFFEKFISC